MDNARKSRRSLVVGIAAAVVVLAALLVVLLTQCTGGEQNATTAPVESTADGVPTYDLYWNVDRALYDGKSEAGMSSRKPESDGYFHIKFILDGKEVTLKTADRKTVNKIDVLDLMGLVFDEEGCIIDVLDVDDMPLERIAWKYFVQSTGGNIIKVNSSKTFVGIELLLECTENTRIYDMSGMEGPIGTKVKPIMYDRIIAIANLAGELTHVFLYDRSDFMLTHEGECEHCEQSVTWKEWTKTDALPVDPGHYQLQNDVTAVAQVSLASDAKMCLDLNGHRVDSNNNVRMISIHNPGAELALMDTSEEKTGMLVGHSTASAQGGIIWARYGNFYMYGGTLDGSDMVSRLNGTVVKVDSVAFFYLYDGTIIGGTAAPQLVEETGKYNYGLGGAIQLAGKMRMYGGTIRDGKAPAVYYYNNGKLTLSRGMGGNIFMNNGSMLEIHDGQVLNGEAGNVGGNIMMDGTAELIIHGGTIAGGRSTSQVSGKNGANIYCPKKATIEMDGGIISGGYAANGGGGNLYLAGTMNMSGGTITGGWAKTYGGNILMPGSATLNLYAGSITGGTATGESAGHGGGNITVTGKDAKLNLYGGIVSGGKAQGLVHEDGTVTGGDGGNINLNRGVLTISGAIVTGGKANGNGGGIYAGWNADAVILSGNARVYGNEKTDICRSANTNEEKSRVLVSGWSGNGAEPALVIGRLGGNAGSVLAVSGTKNVLTEVDAEKFTSAVKALPVELDEEGKLILAKEAYLGESDHAHCLCNETSGRHECADTGFVSVDAENFLSSWIPSGTAYNLAGDLSMCLTEDVVLSAEYRLMGHELNLCLHGHTVTLEEKGRITANGETGTLNITDCQTTGKILGAKGCRGGLLYTYKGTINLYGGTVDGTNAEVGNVGTVCVGYEGDSFTMYGGTVIGRKNAAKGAAVVVSVLGTVNIHGGTVTGGEAQNGGNIYLYDGALNITGGTVSGGKATVSGGNIYIGRGALNISGGTVTGGKAAENGGGLYFGYNATSFALSGDAKLYGNDGSDIFLGSKSSNLVMLKDWGGNGDKGALVIGKLNGTTGSVLVKNGENTLTEDSAALFASANKGMHIVSNSGRLKLYPTVAAGSHKHCLCAGAVTDHECEDVKYTEVTAEQFKALWLPNGKNYDLGADLSLCLTEDVTLSTEYRLMGHELNLCLHGKTVTMAENGRLTANGESGLLTLSDCKNGKIVAAEGCRSSILYTYNGAISIYGGMVDGSQCASANGGTVYVGMDGDSFTMYEGTLIGSRNASNGGALFMNAVGSATIYGGTLTGGKVSENGGVVCVNRGTLTLSGGTVTGGEAAGNGGGIYLGYNAEAFVLSGGASVYGNAGSDIFLGSKASNVVTLADWNGNGGKPAPVIGKLDGVTGSVLVKSAVALGQERESLFTSAHKDLALMSYNGKLILYSADAEGKHMHCLCSDQVENHDCFIDSFVEVSAKEFLAYWIPNGKGFDLGKDVSLCLTENVTLSSEYRLMGHELNLCLHGKTITMEKNGRFTANGETGQLNIADCKNGKILAAEGCRPGILYTYKGSVNLYGGTVDASKCANGASGAVCVGYAGDSFSMLGGKLIGSGKATNGAAVLVLDVGSVTVSGGQIVGGKASENGGAIYINDGALTISGGTVSGGTAAGNGGNICVNRGTLDISGGTVTGGTAGGYGGGLYLGYNATSFNLSGDAKLYGSSGNDICLGSKSANLITMQSWAGNGDKGALVIGKVNGTTGAVLVKAAEGELTAESKALFASADKSMTVFAHNGRLVLYPAIAAADHEHCVCGGSLDGHAHADLGYVSVTAEQFKALWLPNGKNFDLGVDVGVCLTEDVTLSAEYRLMGHKLDLCLHGHTVTMEGTARITANGDGLLNLSDCKNTGKLLAAEGCRSGLLYTYGGAITLYGGTVDASKCAAGTGGAVNVYLDDDSFTMYAGQLIGSKNATDGGTIYAYGVNTVNIHGGTVSGGKATQLGGNIHIVKGTLNITGGQITGGEALGKPTETSPAGLTGGIFVGYNTKALNLSGNALVYGNVGSDIYLTSKASFALTLDNWSGNGDKGALVIGKTDGTKGSLLVKAAGEGTLSAEKTVLFASANENLSILSYKGKLVLSHVAITGDHIHCHCGGALPGHSCENVPYSSVTAQQFKDLWLENGDAFDLPTDANLCLSEDVVLDAEYRLNGFKLNLCLHGHTVTMAQQVIKNADETETVLNGRITANGETGVLAIADCAGGGKVLAAQGCGSSLLYTYKGDVNIYGGTVDASLCAEGHGGAVRVGFDGDSFTMYGGQLIGSQSAQNGGAIFCNVNGTVNIEGGTVTGGKAVNGGSIYLSAGQLNISGGTVEKGTATGKGGNICLDGGIMNLTSGAVRDGSGNTSGNIHMGADDVVVNISGGTVEDGKATGLAATVGLGGNIHVVKGQLNISGGTITGGEAYGKPTETALAGLTGGVYAGYLAKSVNLSGNAKVYGNTGSDIYLTSKADFVVTLDGWQGNGTEGALVIGKLDGKTGTCLASTQTAADQNLFAGINSNSTVRFHENYLVQYPVLGAAEHSHDGKSFISVNAQQFKDLWVENEGNFDLWHEDLNLCLTEDVTLTTEYRLAGYELNLCLHGKTVTMEDKGRITSNGGTGLLYLYDCDDSGMIQAAQGCRTSLLYTYKGSIVMEGGTVDASACASGKGGAVRVGFDGDSFTMNGGKLTGSQSAENGGVIYLDNGTVNITGGTVEKGEVTGNGGSIYMNKGTVNISGGIVTGGKATSTAKDYGLGGSIYVAAGTLNISGGTMEKGEANFGGNIALADGTLNLSAGSVVDGTAVNSGNIHMAEDTVVVNISGGTVSGGKATGTEATKGLGGNIMAVRGQLNISGGVITGGEAFGKPTEEAAAGLTGGIYLPWNAKPMNLSGNAAIYGNTGSDVYFGGNKTNHIVMDEWEGNGTNGAMKVAKLSSTNPALVKPAEGKSLALAHKAMLTYATDEYKIALFDTDLEMVAANAHVHCICGGTMAGTEGHICKDVLFTEAASLTTLTADGSYYISGTVTVNSEIQTAGHTMNLCLNGSTVSIGSSGRMTCNKSGAMNIVDCGTGGKIAAASKSSKRQYVYVQQGTTTLYSGTLDSTVLETTGNGGAVYVNLADASFVMQGGQIIGAAKAGNGGAVYVNNGSFTLNDGTVSGGEATNGGAIYMNGGSVTINGGTVSGGEATGTGTGNGGGNIYVLGGTLTVAGGTVSGGEATVGGNIMVYENSTTPVVNISGGTITGGEATGNKSGNGGGNINASGASRNEYPMVNVSGGIITGGKATGDAGDGGNINLNGGTLTVSGGQITSGQAVHCGGVYVGWFATKLTLSGDALIHSNTGTDVARSDRDSTTNSLIELSAWNGNGSNGKLKVGRADGTDGDALMTAIGGTVMADQLDKIASADSAYTLEVIDNTLVLDLIHTHCVCGGSLDHSHTTLDYDTVSAAQFLALFGDDKILDKSVNLCLTGDVTLNAEYQLGGNTLNLCLNGNTVTMEGDGRITANGSGTLNIADCGTAGNITAAESCRSSILYTDGGSINLYSGKVNASLCASGKGGAVYLKTAGDTLNVWGGTLEGSESASVGGTVCTEAACEINIRGGTVTGGVATGAGGGNLYVIHDGAVVNITGGTVTGGQATGIAASRGLGGNIHMVKGTLNISGGTVTGGQANGKPTETAASGLSGGIYLPWNAKPMNLSGNAKIYGNNGTDIFLGGNSTNYVVLDGWQGNGTEGALKIAKLSNTNPALVKPAEGKTLTFADKSLFTYGTTEYRIALFDADLEMVAANAHVHCICGGTQANAAGHTCKDILYTEATSLATLTANGSYYISGTVAVGSEIQTAGFTMNLCLNGGTVSVGDKGRITCNKSGVLNIMDCGTGGKIAAASKTSNKQYLFVQQGAAALYSGTIDSTLLETDGNGGAVYVNLADASFTMLGGKIIGAAKAENGGAVYVKSGSFTLKGGQITGGTATCGGAIYVDAGSATLSGGTVQDGAAAKGGNIYLNGGGTVTVSGATVSGGESTGGTAGEYGGGNIYALKGTVNITKGTVSGGEATVSGGNIMLYGNGTVPVLNISGGTVSGGVAKGNGSGNGGGNIHGGGNKAADLCQVSISGGIITGGQATGTAGDGGNINMNRGGLTASGGEITGGQATHFGGGIYAGWNATTVTLSGDVKIHSNTTTDLARSGNTSTTKSLIVLDGWTGNGDGYAKPNVYRDSAKANAAVMSSNVALDASLLEQFNCVNSGYKLSLTSDRKSIVLTAN